MNDFLPEVTIKTVKAKYTPFKCVVCNGWGTVSHQRVKCHAFNGRGFLEIPVEEAQE